jgi:hypothetical protein
MFKTGDFVLNIAVNIVKILMKSTLINHNYLLSSFFCVIKLIYKGFNGWVKEY